MHQIFNLILTIFRLLHSNLLCFSGGSVICQPVPLSFYNFFADLLWFELVLDSSSIVCRCISLFRLIVEGDCFLYCCGGFFGEFDQHYGHWKIRCCSFGFFSQCSYDLCEAWMRRIMYQKHFSMERDWSIMFISFFVFGLSFCAGASIGFLHPNCWSVF